jgi:hypothetical protein
MTTRKTAPPRSMKRRRTPATVHDDGTATMTAAGGIRIAVSMRYYLHRNGMTAQAEDELSGSVYLMLGYREVTQGEHNYAQAERERELDQYERDALRIIHGK